MLKIERKKKANPSPSEAKSCSWRKQSHTLKLDFVEDRAWTRRTHRVAKIAEHSLSSINEKVPTVQLPNWKGQNRLALSMPCLPPPQTLANSSPPGNWLTGCCQSPSGSGWNNSQKISSWAPPETGSLQQALQAWFEALLVSQLTLHKEVNSFSRVLAYQKQPRGRVLASPSPVSRLDCEVVLSILRNLWS